MQTRSLPKCPGHDPGSPRVALRLAAALACLGAAAACGACDDPAAGPPDLYADDPRPSCGVPSAPVLDRLHAGAELVWSAPPNEGMPTTAATLEIGTSSDPHAWAPDAWTAGDRWTAPAVTDPQTSLVVRVFARVADPACAPRETFAATYRVATAYEPAAGAPGSTAVDRADPHIAGWAAEVVEPVVWGDAVDAKWRTPAEALGPAEGSASDVVSLGEGGVITLRFDPAIADGDGPDLAVFENAFSDTFLELAFVEVSSDGEHFERFDAATLVTEPTDAYGTTEPEAITGLAGKYRLGFGTPFDLAHLAFRPAARAGVLDLMSVRFVRIVDIVGDGRATDAFGAPVYDPTPTVETAGFDLDGVAALNVAR